MDNALSKLFVYGTLRRGFPLHACLRSASPRFLGKGWIVAKLYDLGDYPGAIKSRAPADRVEGEIYELPDPSTQLGALDEIEEFYPENPKGSLFVREKVDVLLPGGQRMTAWSYLLPRIPKEGRLIPSGDYADVRVIRS
jgi:gamma-glutamylcyclotransferase (GGCT)/AIG2-like uncharacterized protein YtfP